LPKRLEIALVYMKPVIHHVLSRKDMFSSPSLKKIVKFHPGDGYAALKALIIESHPPFHPQPATLIKNYTAQDKEDLYKYAEKFQDYYQL